MATAHGAVSDATRARRLRRAARGVGALAACAALGAPAFAAEPRDAVPAPPKSHGAARGTHAQSSLTPHVVTYRVAFKGMAAGDLELHLTRVDGDTWRYETRPRPSVLARLAVSAAARERGTFEVGPRGVRPLDYSLDDGAEGRGRDEASLEYDYAAGRVRGWARGEPLDLELAPGLQDPLSIRAAILLDLLAGRELGEYRMIDGRQVRTYVYRRVGTERLKTAAGEVETVVYTSSRKGADERARTWKYWYAPSLGWIPVRIEQRDRDGPRLVFTLRSFRKS
jgi:hypothetical protein